jgi:hypothetical protein
MRYLTILMLLIASLTLFAQGSHHNNMGETATTHVIKPQSNGEIDSDLIPDRIAEKLEQLDKQVYSKLKKADRIKARKIIAEIYDLLAELQPSPYDKPHHHQPLNPDKPHGQKPENTPSAMSDDDFRSLVSQIKTESFSDDKLRVLQTAAQDHKFNCNQIINLIDGYTYSADKLEALKIAWPKVTDPQNKYKILDAFTFSTDKEEAAKIMNQ